MKKNCLHNFILCLRLQNVNTSQLTLTYGIPGIYLKITQTLENHLQLNLLLVKKNILVWDPTTV